MFLTWQDWSALALVSLAAAYLGWQGWRFIYRRGRTCGSGGCGKCSAAGEQTTADGKPLVSLGPLTKPGTESRSQSGGGS